MLPSRIQSVLLALVIVVGTGACGDDGESAPVSGGDEFDQPFTDVEAYPIVASSEIVVGENRLLVGLLDDQDAPVANPGIEMSIDFYDLEESSTEPVTDADMDFFWTIKPYVGLYAGEVRFDHPGRWGAEVTAAGTDFEGNPIDVTVKTSFDVTKEPSTPRLGDVVPPVDTPTASDVKNLSEISTDKHPNPRFYESSIADALGDHEPFVVAFATPKFCESQVCGPTLEIVKSVAKDFPKLTFIHVEPYDLDDPTARNIVPAVEKWGLPSEPWVFVVSEHGHLDAKFEGGLAPSELVAAIRAT